MRSWVFSAGLIAPAWVKRTRPWAKSGACGRAASQMASRRAVTWSTLLSRRSAEAMPRIRTHVKVPVGVGFGIRDADSARAVAAHCDAVVVGTALVQRLEPAARDNAAAVAADFIAGLRAALDR